MEDLIKACCDWHNEQIGKTAEETMEAYPELMRRVLVEKFAMSGEAADDFVKHACEGKWEHFHFVADESAFSLDQWAYMLRSDIFYCSDRWSWDRVIRIQWVYQVMLSIKRGLSRL